MVRGESGGLRRSDGESVRSRRRALNQDFERIERGRLQDWRPLLGRKVSIRYRIHSDPDSALSEAIGVVQSVTGENDATKVAIVTRRGEVREVPIVDVLAGKVWPST